MTVQTGLCRIWSETQNVGFSCTGSFIIFPAKLSSQELEHYLTKYDVKRLELYSQNMVDYHLIMDLVPLVARMFFLDQIDIHLSAIQSVRVLLLPVF